MTNTSVVAPPRLPRASGLSEEVMTLSADAAKSPDEEEDEEDPLILSSSSQLGSDGFLSFTWLLLP